MTAPIFPDGEFYSCTDPESLSHGSPWEAIEEAINNDFRPNMTVAETLAAIRQSVTVTAYNPAPVSDEQRDIWADALLDHLGEFFSEEHANPDDMPGEAFPADSTQVMREAVKSIVGRSHVWHCEAVGEITLTPDQVEALARVECPEWFEEPEATPAVRIFRPPAVPGGER